MQDYSELYLEHGEMASSVEGIKWVDLWRDQVNFLADELPFSSPAVFLQYYMVSAEDLGDLGQKVNWQVDVRLFYESFADTSRGSMNRETAVEFMRLLTKLHVAYHGRSGDNFSSMRRVGLTSESAGDAGTLYKLSFTCISIDSSAAKELTDSTIAELEIINETGPEPEPEEAFYSFTINGQPAQPLE